MNNWLSYFDEKQRKTIIFCQENTVFAIDGHNAMPIIAKMVDLLDEQEAALRSALECIARLTPFPVEGQPESLQQAINETANYADSVRNKIRELIR